MFRLRAVLGIGGLFATIYNAAVLGATFGHMATMPQRENLFHFVTAHGPFELTAIVLFGGGRHEAGLLAGQYRRAGAHRLAAPGGQRLDAHRRRGHRPAPLGGRHRGLRLALPVPYCGEGRRGHRFGDLVAVLHYSSWGIWEMTVQLDQNRIAIRERNYLEVLDLTLRVIRAYPGLLVAALSWASCPPCC